MMAWRLRRMAKVMIIRGLSSNLETCDQQGFKVENQALIGKGKGADEMKGRKS
jgi:hypothetical protein